MSDERKIQQCPPIMLDGKGNPVREPVNAPVVNQIHTGGGCESPFCEIKPEKQDYGEPWGWENNKLVDANGNSIMDVAWVETESAEFESEEMPEEIGLRIKACVNACQGIPTEQLSSLQEFIALGISKYIMTEPISVTGNAVELAKIMVERRKKQEAPDGRTTEED